MAPKKAKDANPEVPERVGYSPNIYIVDKDAKLGGGYSGNVYAGHHYKNLDNQVAIKIYHCSADAAEREWKALKMMAGDGVPKVIIFCRLPFCLL